MRAVLAALSTHPTCQALPSQTNFFLLRTPDAEGAYRHLLARGIVVRRQDKLRGLQGCLRVAIGTPPENDALIAAVTEKRIAGAVLDVFRQEPLPGAHPFWSTENILVLPHIGGGHPNRDSVVAELFVDNLGRFLNGVTLREVVDRAAGY